MRKIIIFFLVFGITHLVGVSSVHAETCYAGNTTQSLSCTDSNNCPGGTKIRSCIIIPGQPGFWGSWSPCIGAKCNSTGGTCGQYTKPSSNRACYVPKGIGLTPNMTICPDAHWTTCAEGYICSIPDSGPNTKIGACVSTAKSTSTATTTTVASTGLGGGSCGTPITTTSCGFACYGKLKCAQLGGTSMDKGSCLGTNYNCKLCSTTTTCPSPSPLPSPSPVPSEPPIASCHNVIVYSKDFKSLDNDELALYKSGDQIYFCAIGAGNAGTFTKARFTVNGVLRPEVTYQKPNSNYFCDLYTIPASTYDYSVTAQVFNSVLNWR